jgi:anaerobic selenocysteine-containing dehydrogenase
MAGWMAEIDPASEADALKNASFPMVLVAGRHFSYTANSIMRNPAWNDHQPVCTLLLNEEDARDLGLRDGQGAWISTGASRIKVPVEISDIPARGTVIIPHGFGMAYDGEVYGINVNRLTSRLHRDRIAGTPLHRYVPCRVSGA